MSKRRAYRFLFRVPGQSNEQGPWNSYLALTAYNTVRGAARLVEEWNRRDSGKRIWQYEESLPGDIDHPATRSKRRAS